MKTTVVFVFSGFWWQEKQLALNFPLREPGLRFKSTSDFESGVSDFSWTLFTFPVKNAQANEVDLHFFSRQ